MIKKAIKSVRITAFFLVLAVFFTSVFALEAFAERRPGDLDGDGNVTAAEYLKLKRAVLRSYELTDGEMLAADVNGNGSIDATDYLMVKRDVLGSYHIEGYAASAGLEFVLNGGSYNVTGIGSCTDKDLVIPSIYKGLPVTAVGDSAFEDCEKLTNVTIPGTVVAIGDNAFDNCSTLTAVIIPDSVQSIGDSAFSNCICVISAVFGSGLKSIGVNAFSNCPSLMSAQFAVTEGWWVTADPEATSGTAISFFNNVVAARYLCSTYAGQYWRHD
ncbi:MAG: leucine-rich repeat protein [Clostridia bacterium]|nr:leucine-rich repeat protein [Clostridia bacterium]